MSKIAEPSVEASIDQFCGYFWERSQAIASLSESHFRDTLFVTLLDALARARYSSVLTGQRDLKNKDRFTRLIAEYATWQHRNFHSLPQLKYGLERGGVTKEEDWDLARRIGPILDSWDSGTPVHLDRDLDGGYIASLSLTAEQSELVDDAKHTSLFYTHRCRLVHEFRPAGHGHDMFHGETAPYYHSQTSPEGMPTWELVYPVVFFTTLIEEVLASLRAFWLTDRKDPYDAFNFDSHWAGSR